MRTVNDFVAIAPIVFEHNQGKKLDTSSRFDATDRLMNTLVSSTVLFDSKTYRSGQKLYFRADIANSPFARQKFKHGTSEFILVPESIVIAEEGS